MILDEVKVIKQCQKGNKEAFNELITFYYPFILKYLIKLTSNEELANDMLQETFLKLIKNIDKYDINGKASFSTYLITIARNCYLDYIKKNKNYNTIIDIENISDSKYYVDEISANTDVDIVLSELESLPVEQKIAIKLKYLEGYTLKEIADMQKTKPETIKSRLYEGKKKIKNKLKRRDFLWLEM